MADYPVRDGNGTILVAAANTSGYDDSRDPLNRDVIDTDVTLAADSDLLVASQKATKAYVDAQAASGGTALQAADLYTTRVIIAAGAVAMVAGDVIIELNKTVPATTTVTPPVAPVIGKRLFIKDGAGNAATYPATFSGTLDGEVNPVFAIDGFSIEFYWNGTEYRRVV